MIRHRLRSTVIALLATLVGVGWWATATSPAAAATTKRLTVRFYHVRVVLTVPNSWHVSQTQPTADCGCGGDYDPVCIVASGDYDLDPYNCELVVGGNLDEQRPDEILPDWRLPRCADWTTTYEARGQLGTRPGEYRIFLDRCQKMKSEQWTSLTRPSISIWHPLHWNWDDDVAATAAQGAVVSGRGMTEGRRIEVGFLRGLTLRNHHAWATIDRVVLSLSGAVLNHNPATYVHRLRTGESFSGCPRFITNCDAAQLVAQFDKGRHPADGTRPLAGRLVELDNYAGWHLDYASRYAFESMGDPGHCGCG